MGSARRSIHTIEYGVSELGVWIALSRGVYRRALLATVLNGPLYSGFFGSST
jgi:hypothetical protein